MQKLVLFDIDGTLLKNVSGRGAFHFSAAIKKVCGLDAQIDGKTISGMTDQQILRLMLARAEIETNHANELLPKLIQEPEKVYLAEFQPQYIEILPGVLPLLQNLKKRGARLGLLTGNLEPIARIKMRSLGIDDFFSVGGFGSDPHTDRSDLVKSALLKAGFQNDKGGVYLVGDTPIDIRAGLKAGLKHCIGVATLHYSEEELLEAGAEFTIKNLAEKDKIMTALGLA